MAILKSGYVYVWDRKRKKHNYEHRLVMESIIGRFLSQSETVHHINGNKSDNRESNLVLIQASDHAKQSWEERKSRWMWSRNYDECIDCGTEEEPHHAKGRCKKCDMRFRRSIIRQ